MDTYILLLKAVRRLIEKQCLINKSVISEIITRPERFSWVPSHIQSKRWRWEELFLLCDDFWNHAFVDQTLLSCQSSDHFHSLGACIHQSPCPTISIMGQKEAFNSVFPVIKVLSIKDWRFSTESVSIFIVVIADVLMLSYHSVFNVGSCTDTVKCYELRTRRSDANWICEKHKKGDWIVKLEIKCRQHVIFILVRLISNYSSPPVKVISPLSKEVLIHYIQLNITDCFNNC